MYVSIPELTYVLVRLKLDLGYPSSLSPLFFTFLLLYYFFHHHVNELLGQLLAR